MNGFSSLQGREDKFSLQAVIESFKDLVDDIINSIEKRMSLKISITEDDIEWAKENIEGFAEKTAKPYDIEDIKSYISSKLKMLIDESGIDSLKDTYLYRLLLIINPEVETRFSIEKIVEGMNLEEYLSPEYHQNRVFAEAINITLKKRTISLKTALKQVLKNEGEGTPFYLQDVSYSEEYSCIVQDIKRYVETVKLIDTIIFGQYNSCDLDSILDDMSDLFADI